MNAAQPQVQLRDMLMGAVLTRALQAAAELGIADALSQGSKNCAALADELGVEFDSLGRLLRALTGYGVFQQNKDGHFGNSALSEFLRTDAEQSLRGLALAYGDDAIWSAWRGLTQALRAPGSAFEHVHKRPLFDYLKSHADTARRFDAAMASSASLVNGALAAAYDWGQHRLIVDVGGGSGATLLKILAVATTTKGVVFDLPHAISKAAQAIADSTVADRCRAVAGDFFANVPAQGDAYLLKLVLHDWDDEACVRLLRKCHSQITGKASLLVCERIIGDDENARYAKLTDVVMLALTQNGRERTRQEYAALLQAGGFSLQDMFPVGDELWLMRAGKM